MGTHAESAMMDVDISGCLQVEKPHLNIGTDSTRCVSARNFQCLSKSKATDDMPSTEPSESSETGCKREFPQISVTAGRNDPHPRHP